MPNVSINIPTPGPTTPYPLVEEALNLARVRVNDAIVKIGGEMLTDDQPFTQVMTNAAWRTMQDFLHNLGFSRNRKRVILTGLPPVGSQDPASETWLDWSTFFDGVSFWIPPDTPVLPQDFLAPLRISERMSVGFQATLTESRANFTPMGLTPDGNFSERKHARNGWFDWRDDKIIMPGSIYSMDLEIFYSSYLADFADTTNDQGVVPWPQLPIPIIRGQSTLAYFIAQEFANPRGDIDGDAFGAKAEKECRLLVNNRDVLVRQRNNVSRRPYGGRGRGGNFAGGWGS